MKIAVFGSGPSGLLTAHAALMQGVPFDQIDIFSHGVPSKLFGCQYLHAPIDGMECGDPVTVTYQLEGSPEMYHRKVYGEQRVTAVSPEELGGEHQAWDIRNTYQVLWMMWEQRIQRAVITSGETRGSSFSKFLAETYDLAVSTIPRTDWCINPEHDFKVTEIYAIGDAPELGIMYHARPARDNSVICNGLVDVGWYRMSRVFDHNTVEWPGRRKPPVEGVVPVRKPLSTDCDCWSSEITFLGRYGEWKKGILAHQVYEDACKLFSMASLAKG